MQYCPIDRYNYVFGADENYLRDVGFRKYDDITYEGIKDFVDFETILSHTLNQTNTAQVSNINYLTLNALKKLDSSFVIYLDSKTSLIFAPHCHIRHNDVLNCDANERSLDVSVLNEGLKSLIFDSNVGVDDMSRLETFDLSNNLPNSLKNIFCGCIFKAVISKVFQVKLNDIDPTFMIFFKQCSSHEYHDVYTYANINKIVKFMKNLNGNVSFFSKQMNDVISINEIECIWEREKLRNNKMNTLRRICVERLLLNINEIDVKFEY